VGSKEAVDVRRTVDFYKVARLFKIDTVESRSKTKVDEGGLGFIGELKFLADDIVNVVSNGGVGACNGKIINLTAEQDGFGTKIVRDVNVLLMGSGFKTEFGGSKNAIDMSFPEASTFGVTLESPANGNN
jgi:hypothetical protein